MPNLIESLQGRDLGHLCIVAGLWGIELNEQDPHLALRHLVRSLINPSMVDQMVSSLSLGAIAALRELRQHTGRLPWAQFTRKYGEVREIGIAKRDREHPYENPISAVEELWYRAFVARIFFDTPAGPEEFAYIPDDLLGLIAETVGSDPSPLGRPASSVEYSQVLPATDRILDHTCTFLAALRLGMPLPVSFPSSSSEELSIEVVKLLLSALGLLDEAGVPQTEPLRLFLEAKRGDALLQLFQAWKNSKYFNELHLLPDLSFEGNWENDPLRARLVILGYLANLPEDTWWSLNSFISAIKQRNPDFQRIAGDYDSWFIRFKPDGEFLRGFNHWDDIDGRLVQYIITGPLHWLGVLDLAQAETGRDVTAFRLSRWSRALLQGVSPNGLSQEDEPLVVRSDARISARRLVPRRVRYQVARFCEWGKETSEDYQYQLSSASLSRAQQQGLTISQLLIMLNRSAKTIPPSLLKALERWDKQGAEIRMEKMVVLRVASEDILQVLRKSRASRFLGEPLGPTTISVKSAAVDKVMGILAEMGYLGEKRGDLE